MLLRTRQSDTTHDETRGAGHGATLVQAATRGQPATPRPARQARASATSLQREAIQTSAEEKMPLSVESEAQEKDGQTLHAALHTLIGDFHPTASRGVLSAAPSRSHWLRHGQQGPRKKKVTMLLVPAHTVQARARAGRNTDPVPPCRAGHEDRRDAIYSLRPLFAFSASSCSCQQPSEEQSTRLPSLIVLETCTARYLTS